MDIRPRLFQDLPVRHFGASDQDLRRAWKQPASSALPPKKGKSKKTVIIPQEAAAPPPPPPPVPEPEPIPAKAKSLPPPPVPRVPLPPPTSRDAVTKALKKARKGSTGVARAGLRIGSSLKRKTTLASTWKNSPKAHKLQQKPKPPRKREPPPPLILNDETYETHARKALNGFMSKRVVHPVAVLAVALGVNALDAEKSSAAIVAHAVTRLRGVVKEAQAQGIPVDRRFLHSRASRVYGELIAEAYSWLREAASIKDEVSIARQLLKQQRAMRIPERRELDLRFYERGTDGEIYFLLEIGSRSSPVIHTLMDATGFRRWCRRGPECCPKEASTPKEDRGRRSRRDTPPSSS